MTTSKPTGLRFRRLMTMMVVGLFVCLGLHGDSRAQSGTYAAQLNLNDGETSYNLAPYAYITRDPHKSISYAALLERHLAGKRGDVMQGNMLALGATGVPHWIVVTLNNHSQEDRFVLDFGGHIEGRIGLIDKMFIYDHTARRRIIDTISPSHVPGGKKDQLNGTAVQMNIASGTSATLVMYVVPRAGVPLTLGLNLMTEGEFLARNNASFNANNVAFLLFVLAIGFHLGIILLTRMWGNVAIVLYIVGQMALFLWGNNVITSPLLQAQNITILLAAFAMMAGFAVNKTFFGITKYDEAPFRIVIGVPAILGVVMLFCALILPAENLIRPLVVAVMLLFAYLLLTLMAVAQMMQGKMGALYMAVGWACVLVGTFMTLVATTNVLTPSPLSLAAYWYSLLPQAALMGFAAMSYFVQRDLESAQNQEELAQEQQQVSRIVQSREGQELNRLKRLVEHERQVMQELRDREIEQNEEMRLARIAADEANRAKSAFLAVVSHEIRTPMTGIMGMVRLLQDTPMNPAQKDYAQTIQDSGEAMMSLLNDILDFEKIESGKLDLELIDFDLHRLANSIVTLMSGHAHNKGVYLKLVLDPQVPRYVIGDPVRLRQVLLNLVGNSIKFTKEGGVTITISRDAKSENLSRGNVSKVYFAVRDTGVGISKEAQHNLFRPFAQADSSVSRKFGGTGLGLAISQRLIEAMGNRIAIDSEEGRGSTFHFTLIMEEGRAEVAEGASLPSGSLSEKSDKALKILVVEDNEINQKLLKEFITRMGHEVVQAFNGEEGIEAVQREKPDMVFMDLEMPGISGMGATKAIRALRDPDSARTPVIALTGNTRDEDIRLCYAANMNGHLAKPVDPIRLRQQIDKVINGKLDNPVEIAETSDDDYIHTTQLAAPAPKTAFDKPAPVSSAAPSAATLVAPAPFAPAASPSAAHVTPSSPSSSPASSMSSSMAAQSPVLRHLLQDENFDDMADALPKIKFADAPEKPKIATLVQDAAPLSLQLEEFDLEEDSFAQALQASQTSDAPASGIVFDKSLLAPLKSVMKPAELQEMIEGLLEKAEEIVMALDVAGNQGERATIAARAHELKGMAGNFGLTELSKIAGDLEAISKNEDADLAGLMQNIPQVYKRARIEITRWLEE